MLKSSTRREWSSVASNYLLYVTEAGLLFAGATIAGYAIADADTFNSLFPHPFWIPVILLSVQYGSSGGVVSALLALALYVALGVPSQDPQLDFFDNLLAVWKQPALWILAAVVLGEIRTRHIGERDLLKEELDNLREQRDTIIQYCRVLEDSLADLEQRIAVGGSNTLRNVIDQLAKIHALEWATLEQNLPPLMQNLLGDINFSMYEIDSWASKLVFSHNGLSNEGSQIEGASPTLSPKLCNEYVRDESHLHVLSNAELEKFDEVGVFAMPLHCPIDGRTVALLKIDAIAPEADEANVLQLLRLVNAPLSQALFRTSGKIRSGDDGAVIRHKKIVGWK